ncbi:MAG TPA: helix-turn-helix transcriptional regulator [Ktedonosporobacter sp.]|nr:helix-turn-helix transcriptional regulator [Ktedonosporobacter sp.]
MRGRRERELESPLSSEDHLGRTIRAWRHFRGMSVTELAIRAGFGHNGRGYISKIEHHLIKRLGKEPLAAIARALDLSSVDLQYGRLPETGESVVLRPGKEVLDDAIAGCHAWLRVYRQDDHRLDYARTHFKLAELYWERTARVEERTERRTLLADALQSLNQALPLFAQEAPDSYAKACSLRSAIEKEIALIDLDDAIAGCQALFKIYSQEQHALDWARTHAKLARLYWDRTAHTEIAEERAELLGKALHSLDEALPIFSRYAPVSYAEAKKMRLCVEAVRGEL